MWVKILLLVYVASFLLRTDHSFEQDLGRHLKLGEIITKTQQIPQTNLFSYTNPDFPFINTHWLFEVLVYLVNQTIGIQWMLIAKIALIILSVFLVLKTIPKENQALLLPIGFIFLHVLRERLELRPEVFSFLFTGLTLYILDRFLKTGGRWIFLLPLIQLVWINTHIYFFVGLLIQAIYIIHSRLKLLAIILILSVLLSLLNPNGLTGFLYPFNVSRNYGYTIVENQTMSFLDSINFRDPNFLFVKISIGLVVLSLVATIFRRQWQPRFILLSVSGTVLALMHVRSFPYLVFLSLPAVLANFSLGVNSNPPPRWIRVLTIITAAVLLLESYFYLNGDYYKYNDNQHQVGLKFIESSKGAMDYVLAHDLAGPIYNNFDIGSYLLYRGYPSYLVFVDGRPEAYPASFFTGIYIPSQSDYKNFKKIEEIYQFKTIIFSHTDQTPWGRNFLQNVVKDQDWKMVYIDDFMLVLVRSDSNLAAVELNKLDSRDFHYTNHVSYLRIGLFLLSTGNNQSAEQFIRKTLHVFPSSPVANAIIGNSDKAKNIFFW